MKGVLIKIEVVVLLVLLVILGIKVFQFFGIQNRWSDEIFERTEEGDYLLTQTSAISDSMIIQKYEGTVVSKGVSFKDNVPQYTFELESVLNENTQISLVIPSNVKLSQNSLGKYNISTNNRDIQDSAKFSEFVEEIEEGDFISVETINSTNYTLDVVGVDVFTLIEKL